MRVGQNIPVFADQKARPLARLPKHIRLPSAIRHGLAPAPLAIEEALREFVPEQLEGVVEIVLHVPHRNLLLDLYENHGGRRLGRDS
jgi:hypothetical protein